MGLFSVALAWFGRFGLVLACGAVNRHEWMMIFIQVHLFPMQCAFPMTITGIRLHRIIGLFQALEQGPNASSIPEPRAP